MLKLADPIWLNVLWLLPFVVMVAWFSAVVQSRFRRGLCATLRTLIVAAVIFALARPISELVEEHSSPPVIVALTDVSASVVGDDKSASEAWTAHRAELPEGVYCEEVDFADAVSSRDEPVTLDTDETDIESALDWAVERLGNNRNGHVVLLSDGSRHTGRRTVDGGSRGQGRSADSHYSDRKTRGEPPPNRRSCAARKRAARRDQPCPGSGSIRSTARCPTKLGRQQTVSRAARIRRRVEGDSFVALPLTPNAQGHALLDGGDRNRRGWLAAQRRGEAWFRGIRAACTAAGRSGAAKSGAVAGSIARPGLRTSGDFAGEFSDGSGSALVL